MKSVGLKTIAFELNVSVNTVSRALRDCDDISDETKLKVRQKAYELGYMPNNISQFIKRDGKNLISVVVNSFNNLYFNIVCEKLISLFKEKNYDFSLVYTHEQFLTTNVIKQCISQRTDAIITMLEPNNDAVDVSKLNNIPIVMVGRIVDNDYVDEVYTDDTLGGTLAANYLVNFHRCNKLIYVKNSEMECCQRRQESFVKTINDLLPNKCNIKILRVEELDKKLVNLVHQGYLGIFCFNDETVYECIDILNKDIPNIRKVNPKLHIVGYDCVSTRIKGLMDVTSIDFDYDEICHCVFKIIQNKIKDTKLPKQSVEFTVKLHQRKYV